ncbi:uncharacterized protein LOC107365510 [Tetranychus urticae]|uniref:uncharacterized protein LOC107365510 n=1 Tax=Tetranychus urticae TaxID=32264 RepID=UPI00077B8E6D|nr:uncharacterized protein LOC107365510 [Tetranychus urticae]
MKTIWVIHLLITLSLDFGVIGVTGNQDVPSGPTASKNTPERSSWFDNTTPNSLKPKLFQLPYEKITNPLSSFISWITRNDRNVRIYDKLYLSGKSTGQRYPGVINKLTSASKAKAATVTSSKSLSSPMTSSSNIKPLAVSPSTDLSSSGSSSPLAAIIPSIRSFPVNQRRQDISSSFSFTRPSLSSAFSSSLPINSGHRSNIFGSKDLPSSPQFSISFPRSTPANKRQLSQLTLGMIAKYNPKPKVFFIPKYYPSPYQVAVPFITHDKFLIPPNQSFHGGNRGDDEEENEDHGDRDYDRDEHRINESIENNSMMTNENPDSIDDGDYYRSNKRGNRRRQNIRTQKAKSNQNYRHLSKPGYSTNHLVSSVSSYNSPIVNKLSTDKPFPPSKRPRQRNKSSSSSWRVLNNNSGIHRPAPYTGKAQYSTIDNSADPMSPSASQAFPFWVRQ